ncbi:hypothetical protein H0H93_015370, partial [Arthromyces matolae]
SEMVKRRRLDPGLSISSSDVTDSNDYVDPDDSVDWKSDTSNASHREEKRKRKTDKKKPPASGAVSMSQRQPKGALTDMHPHSSSIHIIKSPKTIQNALIGWYETVHATRGMPWRKPYNPLLDEEQRSQRAYEVRAELFLFLAWELEAHGLFPTISDLANANIDEVNALWKGLGYYSRASRLLAGAKKVVLEYNGRLPSNAKDLERNIPGIGRYSAGAIASIAYGECAPVVRLTISKRVRRKFDLKLSNQLDGNVHRLLSRMLALHAPPKAKSTLDVLWTAATTLVDLLATNGETKEPERPENPSTADGTLSKSLDEMNPGDINQALIELGSTICKVRDPACNACPLRTWCTAYENSGLGHQLTTDIEDLCALCEPRADLAVTAYPMKVDRKKPREELDIVNVIEWRSPSLLAGLHEFPTSSNVAKTTSTAAQKKIPVTLLDGLLKSPVSPQNNSKKAESPIAQLVITSIKPADDVVHVFSHIRKTYRPQWVIIEGGDLPPAFKGPSSAHVGEDHSPGSHGTSNSMWVELKDVELINIGTGVLKVFKSVKKLWT